MDIEKRVWSPELMEAARQAVERLDAEKRKLAAMTPAEREKYVHEWAKRLAAESVEIGERGVGCACCDPDVKAKLHKPDGRPVEIEIVSREKAKPRIVTGESDERRDA